jgi:hypothetical protein
MPEFQPIPTGGQATPVVNVSGDDSYEAIEYKLPNGKNGAQPVIIVGGEDGEGGIDDSKTALDKTWSSQKLSDTLLNYLQKVSGQSEFFNESDGGGMVFKDTEGREVAGLALDEDCPQLYVHRYDADGDLISRVLVEVHDDGMYISTTLSGETWVKMASVTDVTDLITNAIGDISSFGIDGPYATTDDIPNPDNQHIYLIGTASPYVEYIYINGEFDQIGTMEIDLSNYYTIAEVDAALEDKIDKTNYLNAPAATDAELSSSILLALLKDGTWRTIPAKSQNIKQVGITSSTSGEYATVDFGKIQILIWKEATANVWSIRVKNVDTVAHTLSYNNLRLINSTTASSTSAVAAAIAANATITLDTAVGNGGVGNNRASVVDTTDNIVYDIRAFTQATTAVLVVERIPYSTLLEMGN